MKEFNLRNVLRSVLFLVIGYQASADVVINRAPKGPPYDATDATGIFYNQKGTTRRFVPTMDAQELSTQAEKLDKVGVKLQRNEDQFGHLLSITLLNSGVTLDAHDFVAGFAERSHLRVKYDPNYKKTFDELFDKQPDYGTDTDTVVIGKISQLEQLIKNQREAPKAAPEGAESTLSGTHRGSQ